MVDAFVDCVECIYHHGDRTGPRSIITSLFPPAKADAARQYDNATSREMVKIKGNNDFDWNDLAPFSQNGLAKDFDDTWFANEVKGRTALAYNLVRAWWSRAEALIARENQHGAIPVVLWAGKIVEDAMGWLVDMGLIPGTGRGISYTPHLICGCASRSASSAWRVVSIPPLQLWVVHAPPGRQRTKSIQRYLLNLFTAQRNCAQL
jgi:hypothetical protein